MTPVSADDIRLYTKGQCWVLAWHLIQELPDEFQGQIIDFDEHVLVQLGDDRYLDVTGVHTKAELALVWSQVHRMQPIAYDLSAYILPDPEDPENVRARQVARALITHYLADPKGI